MRWRFPTSLATYAIISILLSGCWNRREIDTLGFVIGSGIDHEATGFRLTTQVANTYALVKEKGQKGPSFFSYTATGPTVFSAFRDITHYSPNKLFWSHTKMLVIGDHLAREGIRVPVEAFCRDAEERRSFLLVITPKRAEDIINANVKTEQISLLALNRMLENYRYTSTVAHIRLNDFLREYNTSKCLMFPTVRLSHNASGMLDYLVSGSAILKQDRLITYFTPIETRGAMWVLGTVKSGIINTVYATVNGRKEIIGFEIFKATSSIQPILHKHRITIKVKVEEAGNLGESYYTNDEIHARSISKLERLAARQIESEITTAWEHATKERLDVFGFGEAVHRAYPKEWKKIKGHWDQIFPTINLQVSVKAKITSTALLERKGTE